MADTPDPADIPRVLNPEAIGNPDETPVVQVPDAIIALMHPCECGGLNGFHAPDCPDGGDREAV